MSVCSAESMLFSVSVLRWWRWIRSQTVWAPQLSSTSPSWTTTTTPHSSRLSRTPCRSLRATTQRKVQEKFSPSCPQTPTSAPTERSTSPSPPLTSSSDSERWGQQRGLCRYFLCCISARALRSCVVLQDGTLLAVGSLDRETQETYELVVKASDKGIPQMEVRHTCRKDGERHETNDANRHFSCSFIFCFHFLDGFRKVTDAWQNNVVMERPDLDVQQSLLQIFYIHC